MICYASSREEGIDISRELKEGERKVEEMFFKSSNSIRGKFWLVKNVANVLDLLLGLESDTRHTHTHIHAHAHTHTHTYTHTRTHTPHPHYKRH
jgi:hypothetical protein